MCVHVKYDKMQWYRWKSKATKSLAKLTKFGSWIDPQKHPDTNGMLLKQEWFTALHVHEGEENKVKFNFVVYSWY